MSGILGRKIGMTQKFGADGELVPVTVIQAGPCKVLQTRTTEKDGYNAAILGFEEVEGSRLTKPLLGLFKKLKTPAYKVIREFRDLTLEPGADVKVDSFKPGDYVRVEGYSKGKGWAGAIKRWNFSRGRQTHGGDYNRALGSVGQHTWPARTVPGRKMHGRLGNEKVTLRMVEVIDSIPEENILLLKGPVPGVDNALLKISTTRGPKRATKEKAA